MSKRMKGAMSINLVQIEESNIQNSPETKTPNKIKVRASSTILKQIIFTLKKDSGMEN